MFSDAIILKAILVMLSSTKAISIYCADIRNHFPTPSPYNHLKIHLSGSSFSRVSAPCQNWRSRIERHVSYYFSGFGFFEETYYQAEFLFHFNFSK